MSRDGQSRAWSAAEAVGNVLVGYGIAVLTQVVVFPWFGVHLPLASHTAIGAIFTVVSLLRSYTLRRIFNRMG